ncbi:hypothetical protein LCGC14_2965780, partial [marine sediment metagenome]
MNRDLILLGAAPSREGCPFDTEVWATITILRCKGWEDKHYDKLFNFDDFRSERDRQVGVMAHERNLPVVGPKFCMDVTEIYPMREVIERFDSLFFRNTMSYMIALALYQNYKHLSIWGVDQAGPQYESGRRYVTY